MNVRQINDALLTGKFDLEYVLPHYGEYINRSIPLPFEFGLDELPEEPGIISVRGPRQYGKSTWLEQQIADTIETFGKGTAFYLNGDEIISDKELYQELEILINSFPKKAKTRRIFIDEISSIPKWEIALKRASDSGLIKSILVVTTGSKALDIRRGHEKLPGRKGKLAKTEFIFLPTSYRAFYTNVYRELRDDSFAYYLLSGGSPLACNELYHREKLPEFVSQITKDWILGDIASTGRNRMMFTSLLRCLYRFGGTPVGFAKLARESGFANNTVASGYIEQLSDLQCIIPSWPMDVEKEKIEFRKPCKLPFINLSAALAFHPNSIRQPEDLKRLPEKEKAVLMKWLIAQEVWRRRVLKGVENPEELTFWQSKKHEIDFIDETGNFIEVKTGKASAMEFSWFPKTFPGKRLTVICGAPFESDHVVGMTAHEYLLRDPYFKAYVTEVPLDPNSHDIDSAVMIPSNRK